MQPGIEPRSVAWEARTLSIHHPALSFFGYYKSIKQLEAKLKSTQPIKMTLRPAVTAAEVGTFCRMKKYIMSPQVRGLSNE